MEAAAEPIVAARQRVAEGGAGAHEAEEEEEEEEEEEPTAAAGAAEAAEAAEAECHHEAVEAAAAAIVVSGDRVATKPSRGRAGRPGRRVPEGKLFEPKFLTATLRAM